MFVIILSLICIVICISCFLQLLLENYHVSIFSRSKSLPGPVQLPFIGGVSFILQKPEGFLNSIIQLCKTYSSPFQFWTGPQLVIVIHEPNQAKIVLQSRLCLDKSTVYKVLEPIFGAGLLTASASEWTRSRKIIAPTFKAGMLQKFFDTFVQESLILIEELEKIDQSGNEIIFRKYIKKCAMRISCDTMMGLKMDMKNKISQCLEEIDRANKNKLNRFVIFDVIFNRTFSAGREQQKALNFTHSFIDEMIQQWTNKSGRVTANDDTTHKSCFDIFMNSSNNKFTQKEILDNIFTMILTSIDTIATTIHFVIFMLANFPEIQEKVYKELLELYGMNTPIFAPVKYEDLQHMRYLDCVIKETLRLFPSVPLIGRRLTEELKIGDIVLPKKTEVLVSFISMYRNEKYWPNPLKFDPDRFLSKRMKDHSYYYTPFSDGPRNCIGTKYAMMSMKVILATLIRTFVFKVNKSIEINEIKLKSFFLLSTIKPLKVKIQKRNNLDL